MASRYIIAISYSDVRGKQAYQKYHRQRPLGRLAKKHNIELQEPVYSHDMVDYDLSTNWNLHNLHSKSANALLERDSQNRNSSRTSDRMKTEECTNNPKTRRKANSAPPTLQGKNKKPLYKLRIDYDYLTAQHSVTDVNKKILKHQTKSSMSSASDSSISSRHGDSREESWLRFGGSPDSKGVINAFTEHDPGEFYIVKGDTGSHVAMKLKKGEKIRIGKNGHTYDSTKTDHASKSENEIYNILLENEESGKSKKPSVPLCWQDALNDVATKVIQPEKQQQEKPYIKSNSSKPIKFEKLNPDGLTGVSIKRNNGYRIVHRNKPSSQTDSLTHGVVKTMSYEHVEEPSVPSEPTTDEIVRQHLDTNRDKKKGNRSRRKQHHAEISVDLMSQLNQADMTHTASRMSMAGSLAWTEDSRPTSCVRHNNTLINKNHETSTTSLISAARPRTASSITSSFVVDTDHGLGIIQPGSKPRSKPERVRSPTKPPSARLLHRSKRSQGTVSEHQYIKITSQLRVPTPPSRPSNHLHAGNDPMVASNTASYIPDTAVHPSLDFSHLRASPYEVRQLTNTPITLGSHVLIPTAHSNVGSDNNSMSDFSEHDFNQVDIDLQEIGNDYHHNSLEDVTEGHHAMLNTADNIPDAHDGHHTASTNTPDTHDGHHAISTNIPGAHDGHLTISANILDAHNGHHAVSNSVSNGHHDASNEHCDTSNRDITNTADDGVIDGQTITADGVTNVSIKHRTMANSNNTTPDESSVLDNDDSDLSHCENQAKSKDQEQDFHNMFLGQYD